MAVFRPHPEDKYRFVFNSAHWLVGTCARILAGMVNRYNQRNTSKTLKLIHITCARIMAGMVNQYNQRNSNTLKFIHIMCAHILAGMVYLNHQSNRRTLNIFI